ncbi:MAG: Gfo/Idh/MocA family oxidoreductase, partial [Chloroflexi bacterium]|nr:Gfo/Idh/MocA family oxidoreductase [Chloroflexota bacterium]
MTDLRASLRAGVIGLGAMGANHARLYAEIPGVRLCAVADTDAARASASAHGTAVYGDYDRMLDEARPNLVSVCVPTLAHFDVAA